MVSSEKTLVTITYAHYSNQLRDINPIGWFARYVAICVREVDYVKTKTISFVKNSRGKQDSDRRMLLSGLCIRKFHDEVITQICTIMKLYCKGKPATMYSRNLRHPRMYENTPQLPGFDQGKRANFFDFELKCL